MRPLEVGALIVPPEIKPLGLPLPPGPEGYQPKNGHAAIVIATGAPVREYFQQTGG